MFWKTIIIATLAVGALAEYKISEEQQQQFKDAISNYCKKNGAEDKVEAVEGAIKTFVECGKSLFDPDTLKQEIEDAKPNGALDEVFKKYCAKSPQLKGCIHALIQGVSPCLERKVQDKIHAADNATDQLIDFVCYKDGDRIALFIAEGGPECFRAKAGSIKECADKLKEGINSVEEAKKLTVNEQCAKYDELTSCIVTELEKCETPTPGNMAESLFRYIRRSIPCEKK